MRIFVLALAIVLGATWHAAAQPSCGDPPRVDDQSLKGTLDGKARFLSSMIGDANLKGELETARTDVFSKYPQADRTRSEAYLEYMLCSFVLSDPRLSAQDKLKAIQEFRQQGHSEDDRASPGKLAVSIALNRNASVQKPAATASSTPAASPPAPALPPEQQVSYALTQDAGVTRISYRLPYLDLVRKGGPVSGLTYDRAPFAGELPDLLVTVLNTTKHAVVLTRASLDIHSSKLVNEPIPVFDERSQGCLRISNQGWADIVAPTLQISITRDTGNIALFASEARTLSLPTIADTTCIPLRDYVPAALRRDQEVKVSGTLEYGEAGDRHPLAFATHVKLDLRAGQGVPPDELYSLFFKAGQTGEVVTDLQPAQEVKPDDAAAFLLRIKTDRTSQTAMTIGFTAIDGSAVRGGDFVLDLFVPRIETRNWQIAGIKRQ